MPLVYLPADRALFFWGEGTGRSTPVALTAKAARARVELVLPEGRAVVAGRRIPIREAVEPLATVPAAELSALPPSVAGWALASKLALGLISHERLVPTLIESSGRIEARWAAALTAPEDVDNFRSLARSLPFSAHAVPVAPRPSLDVWHPEAMLRAYLDACADAFVRSARERSPRSSASHPAAPREAFADSAPWQRRLLDALEGPDAAFVADGFAERTLVDDFARWGEPVLGVRDRPRACFRLELPSGDGAFVLRFLLQSPDDPSLLVTAADVWSGDESIGSLRDASRTPQESLLEALGRAARLFPPIQRGLELARPELVELDPNEAWSFLSEHATDLAEAGFGVVVPAEFTPSGRRRLRLRLRIAGGTRVAGAVSGAAGLSLSDLLDVEWQAVVGDEALDARDLARLAALKAPLVQHRGEWIAVAPEELAAIRTQVQAGPRRFTVRDAVRAALAGEVKTAALPASVAVSGSFADLVERLSGTDALARAPAALRGTLRPYQLRGVAWLEKMATVGFGGCLADDMGLGKTIQILAFLLLRQAASSPGGAPTLLVAPTSVVGNWEREIARFAPTLAVHAHYGATRRVTASDFPRGSGSVVLTTYGVLRRDAALLASTKWAAVVLDEAQNIKNAASATARAARALVAEHRFALTGTPVENRLAELWSILEFANPGLLGPLESFRRNFAVPIERYGDSEAAARLRRVVSPFVLRRVKTDPAIVDDLPPKNETSVVCTLTREQASLYKAVVDRELGRIQRSEGVERRGRVLALLTALKQITNHPAQYLGEQGPLARRSGKLARITEMLEEALAAGDRALVFTQYREMGERLRSHFEATLRCGVAFLHGGTPKTARDDLVRSFQEEAHGPRIFVLSLKAGGTGLNLTAANHVFHYDRWWNPAVEDQATDRAYRIGQTRTVHVHKLVCAGTVEDKIEGLLQRKRDLASKIVGAGERWITELDDGELRELVTLSDGAIADEDTGEEEPASRARRTRRKPKEATP